VRTPLRRRAKVQRCRRPTRDRDDDMCTLIDLSVSIRCTYYGLTGREFDLELCHVARVRERPVITVCHSYHRARDLALPPEGTL
jgi:hypothetical protein